MGHLVSIIVTDLDFLESGIGENRVSGAGLATTNLMTGLARHPDIAALEFFLSPSLLTDRDQLERTAHRLLPQDLRGKGRVRCHSIYSLPEIWGDGEPRILYCVSPDDMYAIRYLRDRFARGPMPICSDTHSYGHNYQLLSLAAFAQASPVPFDSIVSLSRSCRETTSRILRDYSGRPESERSARLDIIPRGIHPEAFSPVDAQERRTFRRELGLPESGTIALFLGRVTPHAKADLLPLLHAFARAASGSNEYLVIAGQEEPEGYSSKLLEYAGTIGISERVFVLGTVDPVLRRSYYGAADFFVFPGDTIIETFGSTVIEAMACGLPCIVSDWNGLRDTVVDGETGYKIPTWWMPAQGRLSAMSPVISNRLETLYVGQTVIVDRDRLMTAIQTLMSQPDLRRRMGDAGRQRVLERYTWKVVLSSWITLWNELAEVAARETEEERAIRVEGAENLGMPNPYLAHYAHFATSVVDPAETAVRLTDYGAALLQSGRPIEFYDECLPLIRPSILNALGAILTESGTSWSRIKDLTDAVSATVGVLEDDVLFHIALLMKRDVLELR